METNSKEFKKYFQFLGSDFSQPIEWVDGVGISVYKNYPDGNHASLYKIGLLRKELKEGEARKVLWISVSYGDKTGDGIRLAPRKQKLSDPIDFESRDEYFYDVTSGKFYNQGGEIDAQFLFSHLEEIHLRPSKKIVGFPLRLRLWYWRQFLPFFVKQVDRFLIGFLWIISGESLKRSIWDRLFSENRIEPNKRPISEEDIRFDKRKTMEFFGYVTKRWSVGFYCALHLVVYLFIHFYGWFDFDFVKGIFSDNFLTLSYIVVSFAITEALLPLCLKNLINHITPKAFGRVSSKQISL